jgi:sirohydrochlorin ferrochelatase
MKALILIAHGSRREQSNQEVFTLIENIKGIGLKGYDIYHASFLEIAKPGLLDSIESCVNEGASSIVLLPYFLNSGNHVVKDVPHIVSQVKLKYPSLDIQVTTHIGVSSLMIDLIISLAEEH